MKTVSRISMSLPRDLLRDFDFAIQKIGYRDRSKALQMAIRNMIAELEWAKSIDGAGAGAVIFVYDHEIKGLEESITDIQHKFRKAIANSVHLHLDDRNCLAIVVVKGQNRGIQGLAEELATQRGIKQLKLSLVREP